MPTFYDVFALDDIDINDSAAKFYLIQTDKSPDHQRYKVCATTQDLSSSQMIFDPVTKIKEYWLITREQLNHANLSILFPNDKLRDEPLAITDLDIAFNYDPTIPVEQNKAFHFDPTNPPEKFGPKPIERGTRIPQVLINPDIQRLINLNFITAANYRAMSNDERYNIVRTHVLISSGLITIDEARLLSNNAAQNLGKWQIIALIQEGKLTLNEAKALTSENSTKLSLLHGLVSNSMTAQAVLNLQLNDREVFRLHEKGIQLLIHGGQLTIPQAIGLNNSHAFNASRTQPLISNGFLSLNDVRNFTYEEVKILEEPSVYNLILQHQMSVTQAKALSPQQINRIKAGHANEVLQYLLQDTPDQNPEDPSGSCRIGRFA